MVDQSRTNLAHSAECKARVAEILADDVEFRTKMKRAEERKECARRAMDSIRKVQIGGSSSSGGAPDEVTTHSSSPDRDIEMESAEVEIPMSLKGTKRSREGDLEVDEGVAAKVPLTTSVGTKRGRSNSSSSSSTSSSSDSSTQVEDYKIDGEGDAVMHMNVFPWKHHSTKEYKLSISTKGGNCVQSIYDVSPPRMCRRARIRGLRCGWSLDDSALCLVTGKTWDLLNPQEQKRAWTLFDKTKPKLLEASPPLCVLAGG